MQFSIALASLVAAATPIYAQITINHPSQVSNTRVDPLDSPGKVGTQVRSVLGGDFYTSTWNDNSRLISNCTTGDIADDKSNYIAPMLYFQTNAGKFIAVPNGGGSTTILAQSQSVTAWPQGFRSFSGSPDRRTFNAATTSNNAVTFSCLGGSLADGPAMIDADANCPDGWAISIYHPQCWDGKNLWLPQSAHVAFADQPTDGTCPSTHSTRLPSLKTTFLYMTEGQQAAKGFNSKNGKFVFSNGDPTGYSFHSEFLNGWEPTLLGDVVDQCLNKVAAKSLDDCAPLANATRTNRADGFFCTTIGEVAGEAIGDHDPLDFLPGCNPVWNGTVAKPPCGINVNQSDTTLFSVDPSKYRANFDIKTSAIKAFVKTADTALVDTTNLFAKLADSILPKPALQSTSGLSSFLGCYLDSGNTRVLSAASSLSDRMSVNACVNACTKRGYGLAGLKAGNQCFCGSDLADGAEQLASANEDPLAAGCDLPCTGDDKTACGGVSQLAVYQSSAQNLKRHLQRRAVSPH